MIVIRNTFITFYTKPRRRRCNSMPAPSSSWSEWLEESAEVDMAPDAALSPVPWKARQPALVDVSTEASAEEEEEEEDPEEPPSDCRNSPLGASSGLAATALAFVPMLLPPAPYSGGPVARSPLSSKAKLWTPASATTAQAGCRMLAFQAEAQQLLEKVRLAVQMSGGCASAEMSWCGLPSRKSSCVLTAVLPPEHLCYAEQLVTTAKEAVMAVTSRSTGVCLMGYKQTPFLPKPQGFMATLGEMRDETRACWSMYTTGFCKRGGACRWKHPQTSVSFSFNLVIASHAMHC